MTFVREEVLLGAKAMVADAAGTWTRRERVDEAVSSGENPGALWPRSAASTLFLTESSRGLVTSQHPAVLRAARLP